MGWGQKEMWLRNDGQKDVVLLALKVGGSGAKSENAGGL